MPGKNSILGSHDDRIRTGVRLPPKLAKQISVMCDTLHIPLNAFYVIAACNALLHFSSLLPAKKRDIMQEELESMIQKILQNKRNFQ